MQIKQGEIVALIGLNGAGKTTLIRAITRQLPLMSGEVRWRGQSLHRAKIHDITAVGIAQCIEGRKIFPRMTVRENLELGAYVPHARQQHHVTIQQVFERFPILDQRSEQLGATLSGGEQQMLAIGRALMALPELIIFDEISLGLAPLIIEQLYQVIVEINQQGTTVLLIEQNVQRSLGIAHRAYILENGRIALSGTSAELSQSQIIREAYFGV